MSDFRAVATYEKSINDHRTGRKCARCGGVLHDSIVNFGESLPARALELAFENAKKSDLFLVLGSSLMVTPANEIPEVPGLRKGAKLAICNLQKTPLDEITNLRIYGKTDDLMTLVMEKLCIPIPPFILRRLLSVDFQAGQMKLGGVDEDGTPASFLQSVKIEGSRRVLRSEPFIFTFRDPINTLKVELEFMGHYGEPNLEIALDGAQQSLFVLEYNPSKGVWQTSKQG